MARGLLDDTRFFYKHAHEYFQLVDERVAKYEQRVKERILPAIFTGIYETFFKDEPSFGTFLKNVYKHRNDYPNGFTTLYEPYVSEAILEPLAYIMRKYVPLEDEYLKGVNDMFNGEVV